MIEIIGEKLKQYDLGRKVKLLPRAGTTIERVSFQRGNVVLRVPIKEEEGNIIAEVPNIFLKGFGNITVRCEGFDEQGHEAEEKKNFYIAKREMPADYEYVETETLKLGGDSSGGILADLRFRVNVTVIPNASALEIRTEVLRGDFATAVEKLQNGELLSANVEIKVTDSSGETFTNYEQSTAMYKYNDSSQIEIVIHEQEYSGGYIYFCDDNTAFSENDNV